MDFFLAFHWLALCASLLKGHCADTSLDAMLHQLPGIKASSRPPPFSFLFILTFLKLFLDHELGSYDTKPPLHIGALRIVELSSGNSSGEFLIASYGLSVTIFFIVLVASCDGMKKKSRE